MKTTRHFLLLALLSLGFTACASTGSTTSSGGTKPYPLKTCLVTGSTLGSMGPVVSETYQGQEIKFCCAACIKKFNANPAKYLPGLN